MTMLPDHLAYKKQKENEEEPIEHISELDILKRDLSIMSDNRCKARLYNKIRELEGE